MNLSEFLEHFEFDYEKENGQYKLIDMQGANLGGIEEEQFDTIEDVVERLDIYYEDYILRDLEWEGCDSYYSYEPYLEWAREHNQNNEYSYYIKLLEVICGETHLTE